jgi:hypothetical protein
MRTSQQYMEEARDLGVRGYTGTPEEDTMIAQWWAEMLASGELEAIFSDSCRAIGSFFPIFKLPNHLFYMQDARGLTLAIWFGKLLDSACVGIFLAPRSRLDTTIYRAVQLIYHTIFDSFPLITGVTKREKLLTTFTDLGYNIVGRVDGLLDSQPTWILHLPKSSYENSKLHPDIVDPRRL